VKTSAIVPEFVDIFPGALEQDVLYISAKFSTAAHLCACGCQREVITPLSPKQWVLTFDGNVSLWPSIGNWALPCQSHYVVSAGQIRWAKSFTKEQIKSNRDSDRRLLDEPQEPVEPPEVESGLWRRLLKWVQRG
jgi:hypothetical protein